MKKAVEYIQFLPNSRLIFQQFLELLCYYRSEAFGDLNVFIYEYHLVIFPGRVKNFHFSISSRPALGSTQPTIKWVPGALSRG
jgi:hypothetical protein